ncbi:glutamate racemase [Nocardiopsis lambiniae]|uniref:Aspartate/glutamate racemase family protein n=1 Tax=Nocardiopsis lambiniae TaxID=3075539 RepID=A0ABU2MDV7_9ACTN|nr:aspartate/glutamate racemase family protein [Nocardiopsis sp. DSM 44743]MDT0330863.1 aspartate/glutamate racemase family protein [Nocardiopsis sp. DSM 44743]
MRIALVDSGIGMLSTAAALFAARPDADLFLSMDPDHMPWGPRAPGEVIERALAGAEAAVAAAGGDVDAVVVPCNTASVHGLTELRARFEPEVPVVGTVPAIKPAAASGAPIAVWSTEATTRSEYQRRLVETFARDVDVTPVACRGLAEAVESADPGRIAEAVSYAAERTPARVGAIVLGCTHYDLVGGAITEALGREGAAAGVGLFTAAGAVAAQTLRRIGEVPVEARAGRVRVLASGRPARLPDAARAYPAGRALAVGEAAPTR